MARCSNCGKVNRDGSIFCQDCGTRLEASPPPQLPADGAVCPACRTANPPGMNFCKMCGSPMRPSGAPPAPLPPPSAQPPPPAYAPPPQFAPPAPSAPFLQNQPPANPGLFPPGLAPTPFVPSQGTGPAQAGPFQPGVGGGQFGPSAPFSPAPFAPPVVAPAAPPPPSGPVAKPPAAAVGMHCGGCGKISPAGSLFCQHCGSRSLTPRAKAPEAHDAGVALAQTMAADSAIKSDPGSTLPSVPDPALLQQLTTPAAAPKAAPAFGRLIAVNRDGSDGESHSLAGDMVDVGRSEGQVRFSDDQYLAPRHARIECSGGRVWIRALDEVNGVYIRVRESVPIKDGDRILLGKEVFRFERMHEEERDLKPARQHGVLIFGTPPRKPWARLLQITTTGSVRDVVHLCKNEILLGREEGDLVYTDDEFMSRKHAAILETPAGAELRDQGSSNGTYLRIVGDRDLRPGDLIRLGDQLFRFEALSA